MQDDETLEPEHQNLPPEVQALLRQGREAKKALESEKAARIAAERQAAVAAAGIPEHPARELIFKDYDGPLEAEALKAHAEKFGIVSTSGASAEELSTLRTIQSAGSGAPAPSGDVDLAVAFRNAKSQDEVMAIVRQVSGTDGFRSHDGLIGEIPTY